MATPVKVAALAPTGSLGRLRGHIAPDQVIEVASLDLLNAELRRGGVRWVVIDPMAISAAGFAMALEMVARAGVRILFYTELVGFDHRRLSDAYAFATPELVFRETDDDWARLARLLKRLDDSVPAHVLKGLGSPLGVVEPSIRDRLTALFAWGPIPAGVPEFAAECDTTVGPLRSRLTHAGLTTPASILSIARLSRAYDGLLQRHANVTDVAWDCGFGTARTLERSLKKHADLTPRAVPKVGGTVRFAELLLASCRGDGEP